jgi:hypothetical protein
MFLPLLASCTIMKPPPPMLPALGRATASAKPMATAASTALPPDFRICRPMREASSCSLDTMPFLATTGWNTSMSKS